MEAVDELVVVVHVQVAKRDHLIGLQRSMRERAARAEEMIPPQDDEEHVAATRG